MIKARGVILIGAALVVAFLAAKMLSSYFRMSAPKTASLVVASTEISSGDRLEAEMLKIVEWPTADIPQGVFDNTEDLIGRVTASHIYQGEPINAIRLVPLGKHTAVGLIARIDPGLRAVSIQVDRVSAISNMLHAGDRVDVIATSGYPGQKSVKISRIILFGAKVLAVNFEESKQGTKKVSQKGTATLLLSPEEARRLAASEGALLRLVKRNPSDVSGDDSEATIFSASLGPKKISDLQEMIAKRDKRLQEGIKPGMRAITIRVQDEDGICGFLRSGNRVDVVATHPFIAVVAHGQRLPGTQATVTSNWTESKILMQNVEVLFIEEDTAITGEAQKRNVVAKSKDQTAEQGGKTASTEWVSPWPTKRVTLLVSPENAEKLTVIASTSAMVKLIVRKYGDIERVKTKGEKSTEIFHKDEDLYYDIKIFGQNAARTQKRFKRDKVNEDLFTGPESWETDQDSEI